MTLKEILDVVMLECGLGTETVYASSTDDSINRLMAFANRSAKTLAVYPWQALRKTHVFSLTTATEYNLPADYRAMIPDTGFVESHIHPIDMRTDATYWAYLQSSTGGTGWRYRFRILGDKIKVYQPQSGDTISFEYLGNYPVLSATGTAKEKFSADDDTWVLDDDMLEMDLIWRYKKLLGMDWQPDRMDFDNYLRTTKGQEAGGKTIIGGDNIYAGGNPYTDLWVDN